MTSNYAIPDSTPNQNRTTASPALWGHLLRPSQAPPSHASSTTLGKHGPSIVPLNKASASTRILLHDTQANLEKFTEHVAQLTTGVEIAKRELAAVQKLYQDDHEQLVERMIGLVNRCQLELKKSIGTPVQCSQMLEMSKDLNALVCRVEALDNKIDALNMMNHTQSQALQTIQDQQSQILSAVLPVLPLLQAVPVHIENARNHVKESVTELRQQISSYHALSAPASSRDTTKRTRSRSRSRSSPTGLPGSGDPTTSSGRKKRRLDEAPSVSRSVTTQSADPVAVAEMRIQSRSATPTSVDPPSPDIPLKALTRDLRTTPRTPLAELHLLQSHSTSAMLASNKKPASHTPATPSHGLRTSASLRSILGASVHTTIRTPSRTSAQAQAHAAHKSIIPCSGLADSTPAARAPSLVTPQPRSGSLLRHLVSTSPLRTTPSHSLRSSATPRRSAMRDSGKGLSVDRTRTPLDLGLDMTPPSVPPSTGKAMSLKDRRALLPEVGVREAEKRYIALDDDDEEDIVLVE